MFKATISDEKLFKVTFELVPEIAPEQITSLFEAIAKAKRGRKRSYGGYVIRHASDEVLQKCIDFVGKMKGDLEVETDTFGTEPFHTLHTDEGARNSVTAHHTLTGTATVGLLLGSKISVFSSEYIPFREEDAYILDKEQIALDNCTPPLLALKTTLYEGDLLLFDHSQPHIFRNDSDERLSETYY